MGAMEIRASYVSVISGDLSGDSICIASGMCQAPF